MAGSTRTRKSSSKAAKETPEQVRRREFGEAVRALRDEKGMSEDTIKRTVEDMIKAAYKKAFGSADNCFVEFEDDLSYIKVVSRKTIVDGVYDPSQEIELEEARQINPDCQEGETIDVEIDPINFERSSVTVGRQAAHQAFNENYKDTLYNEYKSQIGQIVVAYYQREHNGNIFLDCGEVEGILPSRNQSPHETYGKGDRIKALIVEIRRMPTSIQLVVSRTDPKFVQKTMELEVPDISEGTVVINNIVREAGYRTKVAVSSTQLNVDPVGACVGQKGTRIQNIIRELDGERVDVLRYDEDPRKFIANALSPAEVSRVVIMDEEKKEALAVVPDSQFSLAIGRQGQNVRLANRLCDWSIDVKTESEVQGMDLRDADTKKATSAAEQLFSNVPQEEETVEVAEADVINTVAELPGVDSRVAELLKNAGIEDIEQFMEASKSGAALEVEGVSQADIDAIDKIISENVVFEEEEEEQSEEEEASDEDGVYRCPECGAVIDLDMTHCPNCGVELEFEEE